MLIAVGVLCLLIGAAAIWYRSLERELTLNQRLIIACYRVDVANVVKLLRDGANVNATFESSAGNESLLTDPWDGSYGGYRWTPLMAAGQCS